MTGDDTRARLLNGDYGSITLEDVDEVLHSTELVRRCLRDVARNMFTIGSALNGMKKRIKHGYFRKFVKDEFEREIRNAQYCMRAAEVLGEKSETVSFLGVKAINKLCEDKTPQWLRDDVVARLEAGERPKSKAILEEVERARPKAPPVPALSSPGMEAVEQNDIKVPGERVCQQDDSSKHEQAGMPTPTQLAGDLILEHFPSRRDELARFLKEANGDELRDYLLRGCAVADA